MLSFLFEQYGYYPKYFDNNLFVLNDWVFKLIEVDFDSNHIDEIDRYLDFIRENFKYKGPHIIKTRFNTMVSLYDNRNYVLVSVPKSFLSLKDLNKLHSVCKEFSKEVNLKDLLNLWSERIEYIESNSVNSLRVDSVYYRMNLDITMFCLGMAQNGLQYLSEIILDYGEKLENTTVTHKSIENLDSFDFFNPFNYVIDHPIRDYVQLYKSDYIKFDKLIEILNYYKLDSKIASVFIARMLYPKKIFDLLEKNATEKNIGFKIQFNMEKEYTKIKKIYDYFKGLYNIRPIEWLEK